MMICNHDSRCHYHYDYQPGREPMAGVIWALIFTAAAAVMILLVLLGFHYVPILWAVYVQS